MRGWPACSPYRPHDPDILTEMDFDGLMAWVDNYCKANPLAKVTTGAAMLVQVLRERAQRK
jgi:hypothetical protein